MCTISSSPKYDEQKLHSTCVGGNHWCQDLLCQSAGALKTAAEIAARNVRREQVDVALSLSAVVIWCSLGMDASLNALKGLQ